MLEIPLIAHPDQRLQIILGGQNVTLRVFERNSRVYTDLDVSGAAVWRGFIAHDRTRIKRYPHLPFTGNLVFVDMEGMDAPTWEGFGSRFALLWLDDAEEAEFLLERNP